VFVAVTFGAGGPCDSRAVCVEVEEPAGASVLPPDAFTRRPVRLATCASIADPRGDPVPAPPAATSAGLAAAPARWSRSIGRRDGGPVMVSVSPPVGACGPLSRFTVVAAPSGVVESPPSEVDGGRQ